MTLQDRGRRVQALLDEAAEEIPAHIDRLSGIRARIGQAPCASTVRTADNPHTDATLYPRMSAVGVRPFRHWAGPVVAVLAAAAMALSAFAVVRPLISSWLGDSSLKRIALQDGTSINRAASAQEITLDLADGYADAARTALTMSIIAPGANGTATPVLTS